VAEEQKLVAYKDSKPKYNKQCYNQWKDWFDRFRDRVRENNQLFNNYSEDLAARKKDESLSRACLFIPVVNPAVLSLAAYANNLLFSVDEPIEVIAKRGTPQENADNVKATIHDDLEKDKFSLTWLKVQIAKHIFPIAFLQVSETEDEEKILEIVEEKWEEEPQADVELGKKKEWKTEKGAWRPTAILRTQESVFYDPVPSEWNQKTFIGVMTPLTLAELVSRKTNMDYKFDIEDLKKNGEKMKEDEFLNELSTSSGQESKLSTGGTPRYRVISNWHEVEQEDGTILRKITTTCGDVELLDRDFPYEKLKITDLFIPVIGYPVLNRVEGTCTADLLKHLQHAINDFFNITIDAAKYGLFPPRLQDSRCKILTPEKTAPGVKWIGDMSGMPQGSTIKDAVVPMFNITPVGKDFFALIGVLRELAEIVSGAPEDILMGGTTDPEEKATKTTYRAKGAATRLQGISILSDVEVLKQLVRVMWVMRLERLPYGEKYQLEGGGEETPEFGLEEINGRFEFDVPHLSGMAEREIKVVRLEKLLIRLSELGFTAYPAVLPVVYDILAKIAELELITDFEEFFPPEIIAEIQATPPAPTGGGGATTAGAGGGSPLDLVRNIVTQAQGEG